MAPQGVEVADIFRDFGEHYRQSSPVSDHQRAVMRAIELCRTPVLGGRLFRCDACGEEVHVLNSCGNRHCPKCQYLTKAQWLFDRAQEILPVPYFHIVCTLPHTLNPLARANPRILYNLLFRSSQQTLISTAANPKYLGARIGAATVLHTWSSRMTYHLHTHSIVQGAGPAIEGDGWVSASESFFLPIEVLTATFKHSFLIGLEKAYQRSELTLDGPLEELRHPVCFNDLLDRLRHKRWVVFEKPPFAGPEQVLEYLGRYTHRVAISNERLIRREGQYVLFRYKDYRRGGRWRTERIHANKFIRRFLLHVLPYRFVRIRYCGLLANRHRKENLDRCRAHFALPPLAAPPAHETPVERCLRLTGKDLSRCPACDKGRLALVSSRPRPRLADLVSRPRCSVSRLPHPLTASRGPP